MVFKGKVHAEMNQFNFFFEIVKWERQFSVLAQLTAQFCRSVGSVLLVGT